MTNVGVGPGRIQRQSGEQKNAEENGSNCMSIVAQSDRSINAHDMFPAGDTQTHTRTKIDFTKKPS